MKRSTVVLLVIGAVFIVPFVYFGFTPLSINGVVVTPGPSCDYDFETGKRSSFTWKSGDLFVDISEVQTCGEERQSVAVQRIGRRIFVRTKYSSPSGEVAACHCRQNFSLVIPGVPERHYEIAVYNLP